MKNFLNLILILFASVLILSCRSSNDEVPKDIHEHEEIEKVVLTLTEQGTNNVQTINYIGGNADGHLHLHVGDVYDVSLDFQHKHGDHYHSMLNEIIAEKDKHFVTYQFSGISVKVNRAENDVVRTDGKKLGIKTKWTVTSTQADSKVILKLFHNPTSVNDMSPSAENHLGSVTGGETEVNAKFDIDAH